MRSLRIGGAALCAAVPAAVVALSSYAAQPTAAEVSPAVHHDLSPPLASLAAAPSLERPPVARPWRPLPRAGDSSAAPDPVVQRALGAGDAPALGVSFDGIGAGFSGPSGTFSVQSAPPDPDAAVGPNHLVEVVNTDLAVLSKTGTVLYGPVPINTLWSGFGGGCQTNNDGDATVQYDRLANRWVITQFSVTTTPYLECVAVSQTPDPTGAYYRYSFQYTNFPDYPKLGVWPDAYYITFNDFQGGATFAGARVCAYDRTKMLAGLAATQQCFTTSNQWGGLLPADMDGLTPPPAGAPNYEVAFGTNDLGYWKFHVDWAAPANSTFTGPTLLPVTPFTDACNDGTCIPQKGTTQKLDSLADRMMYRLAYRNFGSHESLVTNHSVVAGTSVGVRWYELRASANALSVYQQGTYAPDTTYRWMGSAAMDQAGDIALGYSASSSAIYPSIRYTARLATDPIGQMTQGEGTIVDGSGAQSGQSLSRWGDYSSLNVDPSDDCTFWYTNEYLATTGAFNWHTRIGSFKVAGCGAPTAVDVARFTARRHGRTVVVSWEAAPSAAAAFELYRAAPRGRLVGVGGPIPATRRAYAVRDRVAGRPSYRLRVVDADGTRRWAAETGPA